MNIRELQNEFPLETAILVSVGKLTGSWENVYRHCMTVGLVTEIIRHEIHFSRIITSAAILHDVRKRYEKSPQDFTPEEAGILNYVWTHALPEILRQATSPLTRENAHEKNTLESKILCVADMWTSGDRVVSIAQRAEDSRERWPDLDWDFHIEFCGMLEKEIWDKLISSGLQIKNPSRLLGWVTSQITE
ncbi:MAG: hypothetical protein V1696_02415 [Candidatus Jorgensenbacteria bacterium]